MAINLYTSNRMESLVPALAGALSHPLKSPFDKEIIVTQSAGMQKWLSIELSRLLIIWGNASFFFPNRLVDILFSSTELDLSGSEKFSPEITAWQICSLLEDLPDDHRFSPLKSYIQDNPDGTRKYRISTMLADLFDQYLVFRPEIVLNWEKGVISTPDEAWQAAIWRWLIDSNGSKHRLSCAFEFFRLIASSTPDKLHFPERINIFGLSYLPPYHLKIIDAAAKFTTINLFLLNPTDKYWGDLPSARRTVNTGEGDGFVSDRLLSSLGRMGRDFSENLASLEMVASIEELFESTGRASMLTVIQDDMLELTNSGNIREHDPQDRSIIFNSCHSNLREVETLHDLLLDLLETDPEMEPRDIIVMAPDIEKYVSHIKAVFGQDTTGERSLPFSIADRSGAESGELIPALLDIAQLHKKRMTAVELIDILSKECISRHFKFSHQELDIARELLAESGITWGFDTDFREKLGLLGYPEGSWRSAFDRIILGYAMEPDGYALFGDIKPVTSISGERLAAAEKLLTFAAVLESFVNGFRESRNLSEWAHFIADALERIMDTKGAAEEYATILATLSELPSLQTKGGYDRIVTPEVIKLWLEGRLSPPAGGGGFMTGGISFCAMLPMRAIPFKTVALLGMSEGEFPRQNRKSGFDLTAREQRRGDRRQRDEDRYLFLEALLSARKHLVISYVGQSVRDASNLPPSVLVSELTDHIDQKFKSCDSEPVSSKLTITQKLQPFSKAYFDGKSNLFSYSKYNYEALCSSPSPERNPDFVTDGIEFELPPEISFEELLSFFKNPARHFLNRIGIRFSRYDSPLAERELFEIEPLAAYNIRKYLIDGLLAGAEREELYRSLKSEGMLPPMAHGTAQFDIIYPTAEAFAAKVIDEAGGELSSSEVSICLTTTRLSGRLNNLAADAMIRYRPGKIGTADLISAWLNHLFLNASSENLPELTKIIGTDDKSKLLLPVSASISVLEDLVALYADGMKKPLPFFADASFAFATGKGLDAVAKGFRNSWGDMEAEGGEPHISRCFGDKDPFGSHFEEVALRFYKPLIDSLETKEKK